MLSGFPPLGGPLKLLGRAGPLRLLDFARMLPGLRRRARQAPVRATAARARGSTAPRCTATRRPTAPAPAIAAFYLNLLGHAVGWPSPRGGAERLTDALVAYFASLGGELRTGVRVERVLSADGRVTGVAERGRALRGARSSSPT